MKPRATIWAVTVAADQSLLAACQAGTLRTARYDLTARTITPLAG